MSRQHLLLVDADPQQQQLRAVGLRQAGFQVTACADGQEALLRAKELRPDLVLAEADLPLLDGFALLAGLKADPATRALPVVLLSDDPKVERRVQALEMGVADYLAKPVFNKEIVARVRILLQRRESEQLLHEAGDTTGSLADMGLLDLLETLQGRTATVSCTSARGEAATFWVDSGSVIDAECGRLVGESAFFRVVTWTDGSYHVHVAPHGRSARILLPTRELLMEALRRADEWGRILEQLPGLDAVFEMDFVALATRLGDIPDEANAVLRLLDGRRSVRQVVDVSPVDDLSTLQAVRRLYADGIVRVSGAFARAPEPRPQPAPAPYLPPTPVLVAAPIPVPAPVVLEPVTQPDLRVVPEQKPEPKAEHKHVGRDGKPLRGAALAKALAAEARRKEQERKEHAEPTKAEEPDVVVTVVQPPAPEPKAEPALDPHAAVTEPPPVAHTAVEAPAIEAPAPEELAASAHERTCTTCQTPMPEGIAFCGNCGARFGEAPVEVAAETPADEAITEPPPARLTRDSPMSPEIRRTFEKFGGVIGSPDLLRALAEDEGPAAPPERDQTGLIAVVRYPGRKGARRQRLDQASKELREKAKADKQPPVMLTGEVLAPGLVPSPALLEKADRQHKPEQKPEQKVEAAPQPALIVAPAATAEASSSQQTEAKATASEPSKTEEVSSKQQAEPSKTAEVSSKQQTEPAKTAEVSSKQQTKPSKTGEAHDDEDEELAAYLRSRKRTPIVPIAIGAVAVVAALVVFVTRGGGSEEQPAKPVATAPVKPEQRPVEQVAEQKPAEQQPVQATAEQKPAEATAATAPAEQKPAEKRPEEPKAEEKKAAETTAPNPSPNKAPEAAPAAESSEFDKLVAQAAKAMKAEQFERAVGPLNRALKLKKDDALVLRELGKAYYNTNKADLALERLRQAAALNDKDAETYLYLGMALYDRDSKDEAKKAYRRFLFLEPKTSPRYREISAVLQNLER